MDNAKRNLSQANVDIEEAQQNPASIRSSKSESDITLVLMLRSRPLKKTPLLIQIVEGLAIEEYFAACAIRSSGVAASSTRKKRMTGPMAHEAETAIE
jgi:hypothetical protein